MTHINLPNNDPETPLELILGKLLLARGLKLVVAESCTGGLIGHRLTNIAGSSEYYLGSITAYAYEVKESLLGVHHETLANFGAVSRETALEMAGGARKALAGYFPIQNIIGLSVTGIAGPGGGTPTKPVGLVWIALWAADCQKAWHFTWGGNRLENKAQTAEKTLQLLRCYLEGQIAPEN
jgi:nicotinamide-nucleotide amidase